MTTTTITSLEGGKYKIHNTAGRLEVYRHDDPVVWRGSDLVGDKFVGALVNRIEELERADVPLMRRLLIAETTLQSVWMAPSLDDPKREDVNGQAFNALHALRELLHAMDGAPELCTLDTLCSEIVERGHMNQEDLARMRALVEY